MYNLREKNKKNIENTKRYHFEKSKFDTIHNKNEQIFK